MPLNTPRRPGPNVTGVVARVKGILPILTAALPGPVDVAVLTDRTVTIRASVEDVQMEMMVAMGLVVLV
ncbi:efflux RND transporter permease subunit, partial [Azospirillum brasilense]|uniref:efflux RND transporter permease subunit n=1 Tax=Azospirillum brasilense TaxID=192 RepID=UPI00157AB96E|nr:hypothetical protein [Azospirillum brasilense]